MIKINDDDDDNYNNNNKKNLCMCNIFILMQHSEQKKCSFFR